MASVFGHAAFSYGIVQLVMKKPAAKLILLCILCALLPDIDFLLHLAGVSYSSMFGHRGFTHSIFFALLTAALFKHWFYKSYSFASWKGVGTMLLFFTCMLSHAMLDSLTNGGLGVAYFAPFSNQRYFFSWRPIQVSPLGISRFFSNRGWEVIKSELVWIGIPTLALIGLRALIDRVKK